MKSNILIIDDEVKLSELLARILILEGYNVLQAANAKAGIRVIEREDIRVVLSDVKLPDANGVELVKKIKQVKPYIEVINLTAYGSISDGVLAIKNGAFDYLTKGDDNDKIIPLVNKAMDKALLQHRVTELQNQVELQHGFPIVLGHSPAITEAIELAKKV